MFCTKQSIMALSKLCRRSIKTLRATTGLNSLIGDTVFSIRSKRRDQSSKQGLYWPKLSMEPLLRRANALQGAMEAVQAVTRFSVKKEPVSSSIIGIIIINSSLSLISLCYLAPRTIDANNGSQNGPRVG
jgi:hypothetical protein